MVPTIVNIYLNRAAVIPDISAASKGLFASFGAKKDVPYDSENPLYTLGYGLS